MSRKALATYFFALAVVRKGDRFLLVHERKHGRLWYLPAGRVEPGEELVDAVRRETLEEAGVPITVRRILRIEHAPLADYTRVRVFFLAEPSDDTPPKSTSDEESLEAGWFTLEELRRLPLRGTEAADICAWVADGATGAPLSLLTDEGAPFV